MNRMAPVFVIWITLTGCQRQQATQPSSSQQQPASAQSVSIVPVEAQQVSSTLTLPAQIIPYEIVNIYPKVTGFVEEIRVDRGSRVKAGEILARLSAPELLAQRSQAEAHLLATESQLVAANAKLTSDQGTYDHLAAAAKTPGVVAGNDLAVAEQTAAADRAQAEAAQSNVKAAQDALGAVSQLQAYLDVRAPFDGVVTERNFHIGALVGPSSGQSGSPPIVQIEDVNRLRVVIPVPEPYVVGVTAGRQVSFTVPSYPGRTFHAPIARISDAVDHTTRTMAVELDLRDRTGEITPGIFATVQWPVRRAYPTLLVPASAITTDLQRTFVIRVRNGKAEWVDVTTGMTVNGKTEVFGQLEAGDKILRNATDAIRPGAALTPAT